MNFRGIVISPGQLELVSVGLENRRIIIYDESISLSTGKDSKKEKLWFSFGYDNAFIVVVARIFDDLLSDLIFSGLLCDLRETTLPRHARGMYDYIHAVMSDNSERIRLCNVIRDTVSNLSEYRWCGGELELLSCPQIYTHAVEIIGNNPRQHKFTLTGDKPLPLPLIGGSSSLLNDYNHIIDSFEEDGQRKLAAIMYGIPTKHVDVIYVGGSPGVGWVDTLSRRVFARTVVNIDPADMVYTENLPFTLAHQKTCVRSASDLYVALNLIDGPFVFIWDVRSDVSHLNEEERSFVIQDEIFLLNAILKDERFSERCIFIQLKVNASHLSLYEFPLKGDLYLQPFTLTREIPIYELRYVYFGRLSDVPLSDFVSPSEETIRLIRTEQERTVSQNSISNLIDCKLYLNFICSIVRRGDYTLDEPLILCKTEVALFTLNWNDETPLRRFLDRTRLAGMSIFGSFFTKSILQPGEFIFPERILFENLDYSVFDSRAIIPAKISYLYFFCDGIITDLYTNELIYSETYLIRATEFALYRGNLMSMYDEVRDIVARDARTVFPKFPIVYSVGEELISPSGHALRMAICRILKRKCIIVYVSV